MNNRSNYTFCTINGYRIHIEVCKKCNESRCLVNKQRLKEQRRKVYKKKVKKLDEAGVTRSLLLKPEDRLGKKRTKG